ncbi:MAG: recombinase family protein [Clostridia bacterium]|nr:recombinase family protein [Clostridia bacterium]
MHITDITPTLQKKTEKIRLAPYCRVSSDSADQLHSFAAQIRYYSEYAKRHPEYELVDIYADEGITGTDMSRRDDLHRLLRDCKLGKVDRIICKTVARFTRNTEELLTTLRMLKEIGVSVYFEEQGIDTDKMNMEMIVTFPGMAAQQESEAISGNVRWSIQKRMQTGEYAGTYPAYGYRMKDGKLEVNEEEAEVVRRIFTLYLKGYGVQAIATILNEDGVPRRTRQIKWYSRTVRYILANEKYVGDALLQKKYRSETPQHKTKRNKGEKQQYYVENSNPPIVSREVFAAVTELLKSKGTFERQRKSFPLTGTMVCPECGKKFRRQITEGRTYWICNGRTSGDSNCQSRRVREDMVYDAFMSMADKLADNRKYLLGTLIEQIELLQNKTSKSQERIREIDKELADLGARNLVIARLHTSGVLNTTDYSTQTAEIGNKITELRIERRKKLSEDEDDEMLDDLRSLDEIMSEYIPTSTFNEDLFGQIVESITVDDSTQITFKLIGGIELTEPINEKGRCKTA